MPRKIIGFDLDGTLVENVPFKAYEEDDLETLANALPIPRMVEKARSFQADGFEIVIITGRHMRVNKATRQVVKRLGLGPLRVFERLSDQFDLSIAVHEKALHLIKTDCMLYIGDRHDLDGKAAAIANVPFMHIDEVK